VNSRRHSHPRALARAAGALAALAGLAGTTAALADDSPSAGAQDGPHAARAARAQATAYARDEGDGNPRGFVTVSGDGSRGNSRQGTAVAASTKDGKGSATATARVEQVSLLGDMVTADTASVRASANGGAAATGGRVTNLIVAGDIKGSPRGRATYDMQGYGKLTVLDDSGPGILALKAKLTRPYGSYPAGTVIRVAYAAASAHDGPAPKPEPKPPKHSKPPKPSPKPHHAPKKESKPKQPARRRKPSRTHVLLTSKGFVFPVYGKHNFGDTYGAFRADTGFHEGNDIFGAAGTPLVAVCDGSLNRVGTLPISGNRLWVKCTKTGDSFFYAHLSAFATDTRNALHVKAGQVIGFLGSTGDAEQTPPHLHFEVHPGDRGSVDPYPFLRAWESRRDVPAAAWVRENGQVGQQPGTLVVLKDFLSP
jgi:murein DD-endopeptidase MepM/ murein hydrolase activator NlpD